MDDLYDLVVVGGGPAGTAAAITAVRAGARVLVLERGSFPRQRVCGEFVSSEALGLFCDFIAAPAVLESAPRITSARLFSEYGTTVDIPITTPAASIPRWELDDALWNSAKRAGIECRERVEVAHVERHDREFLVGTSAGDFRSRTVIDASGRWSRLNCGNGAVPGQKAETQHQVNRLGLKAHFDVACAGFTSWSATTDLYFFPGGYCGVQPVTPTRVNVCAMVESSRATSLDGVFRLHSALAERSRHWTQATEQVTTAPLLYRRPCAERDGVLRAGDAAGFIDPFAGDGISLALRSGALAATTLASFRRGKTTLPQAVREYRRAYHKCFARAFRMAALMRGALNAPEFLRRLAWRSLRFPPVAAFVVRRTR